MPSASLQVAGVVLPTALAAGVGWAWSRWGPALDRESLTQLISWVGAPCLVFSGLVSLSVAPAALLQMAWLTVGALLTFAALGLLALRLLRLPATSFLAPLVFGNVGNMGLPLCASAFGPEGLALGLCGYAVTSVAHFTLGVALWSGRLTPRVLLANPLSLATLAAVAVIAGGIDLPRWLLDTTGLLGQFTVPLMLLSLGLAIGELGVRTAPRQGLLAVLKLGMGAGVGFALSELLGLDGVVRQVFVLQCSMPAAVFNYLMAQRYGRRPQEVAGMIVASTLLAFALLPLLLVELV